MPNLTQSVGAYTVGYATDGIPANAVDIGTFEGSLRENRTMHAQDVRAGRFGDTVLDGVYRGANVFQIVVIKEWTEIIRDAIWPFDEELGNTGIHGRMLTDIAGSLVLTAIAGTTAAVQGPVTRTYPLAILSPEHNTELIFGAEERNIPIVFRCYPNISSGGIAAATGVHYTDT